MRVRVGWSRDSRVRLTRLPRAHAGWTIAAGDRQHTRVNSTGDPPRADERPPGARAAARRARGGDGRGPRHVARAGGARRGRGGAGKTALARRFTGRPRRVGPGPLGGVRRAASRPAPSVRCSTSPSTPAASSREVTAGGADPHEVAVALLRELARRAPTVLVLEDLHWADEATLDVVRLLGAQGRTRRRRSSSRPIATTSSSCATPFGSCSASWPARRGSAAASCRGSRSRRSRGSPSRTASTRASSTAGRRQPVLPLRGAGRGRRRHPADRPRRGPGPRGAPERDGGGAAGRGRRVPAPRRAVAAGRARRGGGARLPRRVPGLGHADLDG